MHLCIYKHFSQSVTHLFNHERYIKFLLCMSFYLSILFIRLFVHSRCSVDPFLFENFNTVDGDFLTAKFRAFKFPDSTYVQFRASVNACVDKCKGIPCSNGQIGYGRRKREIAQSAELEYSIPLIIRVVGEPVSKGRFFFGHHSH